MDNLLAPATIIGVITGLVQFVKQLPIIADNKRWCPSKAIMFGLLFGIAEGVSFSHEPDIQGKIFNY